MNGTDSNWQAEVVRHHLRLFGAGASARPGSPTVSYAPDLPELNAHAESVDAGQVFIALSPTAAFVRGLGATCGADPTQTGPFHCEATNGWERAALRTFFPATSFVHPSGHALALTDDGKAVWLKVPRGKGWVLLIGTDIAADLVRFRQGDPAQAATRPTEALWGIAGERPNYLFEKQNPKGHERERQADWWAMALAQAASDCLGVPLAPILPFGAPGALVITGDDDQAQLEKYDEQLAALDGLPITYFLHPLTKHTRATLDTLSRVFPVELGLHPDALADPQNYAALYREQSTWFERLTSRPPRSVRNHGFLNDGYWGHLPVWLETGATASSNIPGLNGAILNGSLLPARMLWEDRLTSHWSVLTAVGDGVRFALGLDGPQSAQVIRDLADRIVASRLPGVIVLNLHPQNIAETREMHAMLHELVREGFLPMSLGACISWFEARDQGLEGDYQRPQPMTMVRRVARKFEIWRGRFFA